MLVDSVIKPRIDRARTKQGYLSPEAGSHVFTRQTFYPQNYYQDIKKRPLNNNPQDLSFKGLSFIPKMYKPLEDKFSKKEFIAFSRKYLGDMGEDLFDNITIANKDRTNKLISVDGDKIIVHKKTIPHLALDGILYPFKILPFDILNGAVELLAKVPFLKNWANKVLKNDFFKNIRQRSKVDKKVNSLVGMISFSRKEPELINEAVKNYTKAHGHAPDEAAMAKIKQDAEKEVSSQVFQTITKQFDYKTGNYDTKHERALNRLVSGLPPAIFLANDAYNLSRMMDDDPKAADKERKIRFKQETSRILASGYLTLITMGAFQKFINKSKFGIVLTTGITVLFTEMFSRLSNGKYITRLTPEQARKINEKNHAPEADIKPVENKGQVSATGKSSDISSSAKQNKTKEQKPLLSFGTLMKASAAVLAAGYTIKGVKNLKVVKKAALKYFEKMDSDKITKLGINKSKLNINNAVETFEKKVLRRPFNRLYDSLTSTAYHVDSKKFEETIKILKEGGYSELADMYEKVGKTAIKEVNGQKFLDLGTRDKVFHAFGHKFSVKPIVKFFIAPFKFMWNTVTLPYWMVNEKIGNLFRKAKPKPKPKDIDALKVSLDKISSKAQDFANGKMSKKEFQDFIEINIKSGFNKDSLSSVSNAELSNLAKTAATAATIWFLMTDNYNMVMLKSNGNDKEGAETKFKERFVQEISRLFYQTLLIDLFNSTFMNSYNSSLAGMSWVTLADTTLGEILTRSSVGMPIKPHTRDELIAIETKQNNSTGFKKKYYNFMQRLTGKRSIKTYEVDSKGNPVNTAQSNTIQGSNIPYSAQMKNSSLEKMING